MSKGLESALKIESRLICYNPGPVRQNQKRASNRPTLLLILGVTLSFSMGGCLTIDDLSHESYRNTLFSSRALASQKVGILPVMGRGSSRKYLQEASSILAQSFVASRGDIQWLLPEESRTKIDQAGASQTYLEILKLAQEEKIPREEDLKKLGEILGTPYLLLTTLQFSEVSEGASHVTLSSQFWDVNQGQILWKEIGEARGYVFLFFPAVPSSFEKAIKVASEGLIKKFP